MQGTDPAVNLPAGIESLAGAAVLVTGATGFTGRVLTRKLVEAGARVRAIARASSELGDLADLAIDWYRGDVFDPEVVSAAAAGVDVVFHVAAAFREVKSDDEGYRQVHLESTRLLARAVLENPAFRCFVLVSTVGVHGNIENGPADETYRFAPGDGYQRTKLEAEQWLVEFAGQSKLPYTIIRPGPIYGPGDMRLLKIYRMASRGYILILGSKTCQYHLVHVEDLTNVILLSAVTEAARSEAMIAVGDEPLNIEEMAQMVGENLGRRVRTVRLPLWPFYLAADICTAICRPFGIQPPIFRRRVDFYTKDRVFTNARVKKLLGYRFLYDNAQGVAETTRWYLDNGHLK